MCALVTGVQTCALPISPVQIADSDGAALRDAVATARKKHGAVRAVLHLHALSVHEIADLAAWRARYRDEALSLFHVLQTAEARKSDVWGKSGSVRVKFGGSRIS